MMHFIDFQPEHLLFLNDLTDSRGKVDCDIVEATKQISSKGPCLTLYDDEVLACGGLMIFCKGFAEIWLKVSKTRMGPHVARELKAQMFRWIVSHDLHRLQATGPTYWTELERWWEWLGMQKEGVMRKWGSKAQDHFLYAWVK